MRVKFEPGKQREFLLLASEKAGSLFQLSIKMHTSYSMLKKYAQNRILLPCELFKKILDYTNQSVNNYSVEYLDSNWGRRLGASRGMAALKKKYPEKIKEWRSKAILKSSLLRTKKINQPVMNENLAEFIGAFIGDGTLTKYYIRISGDVRYDLPYYDYLNNLVFELFGIRGVVYRDKNSNTANIVFFSKELCNFFRNTFLFKNGDKLRNNTIIPKKILEDRNLSLACLRGLVDTDGSVSRRGREGEQFTIVFTSHNSNLLKQVKSISDAYTIFSFVSKDGFNIGTNSFQLIKHYFSLVGSSNLRHIVRFNEKLNNNTIYQNEVYRYYQKDLYRQIKLPFRLGNKVS